MKLRKNLIRTISAFSLSVICFFLFLFFLYEKDNKYTDSCLQPISGILCPDEESLEKDIFYLTNQWQFYPDASLTPRDFKQGLPDMPMEFITIGKYNDFSLGDRDRSPYGLSLIHIFRRNKSRFLLRLRVIFFLPSAFPRVTMILTKYVIFLLPL